MEYKRDLIEIKDMFKMMSNLFDMVFLMKLRKDGNFEYADYSEQAKDLANLPDDAIGKTLFDIYGEEIATALHEKYTEAIVNREPVTYLEAMNLRNNNQFKVAESTLIPITIDKEKYVLAFIKDVTELELKKHEVFEQKERFHSLFTYNNDPIISTDVKGNIQIVNEAFRKKFSIVKDEFERATIVDFFPQLSVFNEKPHTIPVEEEVILEFGSNTIISLVKRIPIIVNEENIGFYFIINDVTSQREVIVTNNEMEERYKRLMELSPQMIILVKNKSIIYINKIGLQLLETKNEDIIGKNISYIITGDIEAYIHDGNVATIQKTNNELIYVSVKKTVVFLNKEKIHLYSFTDVTSQLAIKEELTFMENFDYLTGLHNRKSFDQLIDFHIVAGENFYLILFNIDKFKFVNDLIGTSNADLLLEQFASRLKSISDENTIGRISGDEFAIILPQKKSIDAFLMNVQKELHRQFDTIKGPIHVSTSTAISRFPEHGSSAEQLYLSATKAMTLAKIDGAKQVIYYQEEMQEVFTRKYEIENELKLSLKEKHFHVVYQPKIHLKGKPLEVEALIRWEHPKLGMVSPAEFIPVAEDSGLIIDIGKFVIDQACKDLLELHKSNPTLRVAINLSPKQFMDSKLEESILAVIARYNLDPGFIEFEITETAIMSDPSKAVQILNRLKEVGITFAIDDFGTSFSSFNYLKKLPVDTIKIDRSFINGIGENEKDSRLVEGLIDLAHKMGLSITAEGVETKEQLHFLLEKDCDVVQGYYFGRPEKLDQLVQTLTTLRQVVLD
ncbi:bifunctional diguanylate cyclase/phosphodiesterase [Anaerobacillus alkaliphilus]|uniref:Bifunctional diguanylate cyclase/phosphodiesterase n=1 Tax=Anaerobacillus alkaliphilus TaxID=1548597 RepID=A0A4Q0VN84_9BACI|nr:bifunctional diguanylate cyclase/phosphodiesterase [Anaerobacillus alkaliphilus]RXI97763.1 bifunctional diguanylate cyclase/phosphodiesterase [Anaerobacillus alkaliphilus]